MKKQIGVWLMCICLAACSSDITLFQKAKLAASKGNYAQALSLYTQLIKKNPQHAAALINRGLMWERVPVKTPAEKAKNLQYAEQDYLRSLDVNPNQSEAYNNLGALYLDRNQAAEAVEYLTQAVALNPSYFRALMNRAVAYTKQGRFAQALMDYNQAAQLRPNDPVLLLNRALTYMDMGKYEQADNDLTHAIVMQPNHARLYVERARVLTKMGYPADAYDDLTMAISLKPGCSSMNSRK